jgi:hypothetical protein
MGHIRLRGHSFANVLLIAAQRPEASLVASYEQWQALGRQVNRGERGIQIIAKPAAAAPPWRVTPIRVCQAAQPLSKIAVWGARSLPGL